MMIRSEELLWKILLEFKKQFYRNSSGLELVSAIINEEGFKVYLNKVPSVTKEQFALVVSIKKTDHFNHEIAHFFVDGELMVHVMEAGVMNEKEIGFISCFLPFCVMPYYAFKLQRAVSVLHLAQSIDGRMATINRNSKWISNQENLVYVHRMRALSDGILIGAHTLHNDKPALTVRYVTGPNPVKIVVGNSAVHFASLLESKDRVIHLVTRSQPNIKDVEMVCLDEISGYVHPMTLLKEIYRLGINSVYIEGGAFTSSSFIKEKAVDMINFYIAPVILGSGISIEFQGIVKVGDALNLQNCTYMPMGEGILIRGYIKQNKK